jgi:hypothetical protein
MMQVSCPGGARKKEQRKTRRHSVNLVARIVLANGADLGLCQVADLSGAGAHLKTSEASTLPDEFVLLLAANGTVRRACYVVWRSEIAVGVEFFS